MCLIVYLSRITSFNSRTPCGVRQGTLPPAPPLLRVSIHAPRVGCDSYLFILIDLVYSFNSRTPCGVRLGIGGHVSSNDIVSIHAPRVGCDTRSARSTKISSGFNSRTPCGVRRREALRDGCYRRFNSRTPCGVRQLGVHPVLVHLGVSIHAPRVGCDSSSSPTGRTNRCFNSRTPCGVRRRDH